MKDNIDGKLFILIENTDNGEVNTETLFHYHQDENIISADYSGGTILKGHLLGEMSEDGSLEFTYHHINFEGSLMLGKCTSVPTLLPGSRLNI